MPLREYAVDLGSHTATMLLSDEDAERYGDKAKPVTASAALAKAATATANKARSPQADKARD